MEIKIFGVIGAGQMGNGIAQVAAMSGLDVIMNDIAKEFVDKGLGTITKNLDRNVEKGKMTKEDRDAVLGRIKGSVAIKDMASADFVIEAATERQDLKFQIFKDLDGICRPGVILCDQYIVYPHRPNRLADQEAGKGYRYAFHESCAGHETG